MYGGGGSSERVLGSVIQKGIERGLWERMDLVITTKLHMGGRGQKDSINSIGLSRKHLYEGCVASLARLQLEYVDCIFCHRPDPRTPIEETVRGMNHMIEPSAIKTKVSRAARRDAAVESAMCERARWLVA